MNHAILLGPMQRGESDWPQLVHYCLGLLPERLVIRAVVIMCCLQPPPPPLEQLTHEQRGEESPPLLRSN